MRIFYMRLNESMHSYGLHFIIFETSYTITGFLSPQTWFQDFLSVFSTKSIRNLLRFFIIFPKNFYMNSSIDCSANIYRDLYILLSWCFFINISIDFFRNSIRKLLFRRMNFLWGWWVVTHSLRKAALGLPSASFFAFFLGNSPILLKIYKFLCNFIWIFI